MEKFVMFEVHEYMDMYPRTEVRTWKGDDEDSIEQDAKGWATAMNQNYSGGTTRFVSVMTAEDAKNYLDEQIQHEKANWQEDSQEFIDKITNLYNKCYGKE